MGCRKKFMDLGIRDQLLSIRFQSFVNQKTQKTCFRIAENPLFKKTDIGNLKTGGDPDESRTILFPNPGNVWG